MMDALDANVNLLKNWGLMPFLSAMTLWQLHSVMDSASQPHKQAILKEAFQLLLNKSRKHLWKVTKENQFNHG
jgi:hypothetical protein